MKDIGGSVTCHDSGERFAVVSVLYPQFLSHARFGVGQIKLLASHDLKIYSQSTGVA